MEIAPNGVSQTYATAFKAMWATGRPATVLLAATLLTAGRQDSAFMFRRVSPGQPDSCHSAGTPAPAHIVKPTGLAAMTHAAGPRGPRHGRRWRTGPPRSRIGDRRRLRGAAAAQCALACSPPDTENGMESPCLPGPPHSDGYRSTRPAGATS